MSSDATPTALFATYEQDFQHIIQSVRSKLEGQGIQTGGVEQRKAILRSVEIELDDADDIVSQLQLEIQGIPKSIKPKYIARLKQVNAELAKYKKLGKDLHSQLSRTELLLPGSGSHSPSFGADVGSTDNPYGGASDRGRLLAGMEILTDGQRRLGESTMVALRTEEVGSDILRTLRGQRETIEHARDTVGTADSHLDRASGTLKGMISRMYRQRIIMGAILAFFVALIMLILYLKFVR